MKLALIAGAILSGLMALMAIGGALLPKKHVVSRSAEFKLPPGSIWAAITNVESYPEWRTGVTKVEIVQHEPKKRWREKSSQGEILFELAEAAPPNHLVTRIADPKLPFGGTWTYEIAPSGTGSRLTITENGEVYNVFFRFLSRFVFGYASSIDAWMKSLAKKSGDSR